MTDAEVRKLMREWCVPPKIIEIVLAAKETEALGYAREFLHPSTGANIMVLAGGVGVGKSVAAAWTMLHYPHNQYGSWGTRRYRHISELFEVGYGDEQKAERERIRNCRFLVLDDVGTEHMTEKFQSLFDGLINARYEADGITVITTNLPTDQFRVRYGERIFDRLCGRGAVYEIAHESLRGKL